MSKPVMRTYGSKPRKISTTHLWDGSRDVPRRQPLGENTTETNERKNNTGLGGFMKGMVDWLSPKKPRQTTVSRKVSRKENRLVKRGARFSLSDDDDGDVSVASTSTTETLIASTPKKEAKEESEKKEGVDLLLQFCSKEEVVGFAEYIDELLLDAEIRKIGEASYSEVFSLKHGDGTTAVLKMVPFDVEGKDTSISNLEDILQEIRISRAMTNIEGFADFHGAMVVKGVYPEQLLTAWDAYTTDNKSENDRPSKFPETQTYCIIQLAHHGEDLESHAITTWSEAAHIFWSVVRTLARGETETEFEHRDLHWGNILIDKSEEDDILERLLDNLNLEDDGKELLDGGWGGVKVTLIDFTLSRATVNDLVGQVAHYGFEDETLFEGKRDYQFDIYRQMRSIVSDENGTAWAEYRPATNVLWLHYLANKLLYAKQLPTPVTRLSARNQSKQQFGGGPRKRGHERSFSVILEGEDKEAYEGLFNIYTRINPKNNNHLESAAGVLEFGRENGWVA